MGIGSNTLSTSQRKEQSGAPFVSTAARNGVSVDTLTDGAIVLGNDDGLPIDPAVLTSDRIIATLDPSTGADSSVVFRDNAVSVGQEIRIHSKQIQYNNTVNRIVRMHYGPAGGWGWTVNSGACGGINITNGNWQFNGSRPSVLSNGSTVQITGNTTYQRFVQGISNGAVNIDRDADSSKYFSNENATGAVTLNSPVFASSAYAGFNIGFGILSALGITFQLQVGQVLYLGGIASSSGGTFFSTTVGSAARILLLNPSTFVVESYVGVWGIT